MDQFVSKGKHVKQRIKMTGRCVEVYWFYRMTTGEMNTVKALGQTEQIPVVLAITHTTSFVKIRHIWRTCYLSEGSIGASKYQAVIGISRL